MFHPRWSQASMEFVGKEVAESGLEIGPRR